jgi:toxin ParE1/3/4
VAAPRRVVWSGLARRDLLSILEYVAADSPDAGARLARAIVEQANSLDLFPERGRVFPPLERSDVREVFVYRYRIIYLVTERDVIILSVVHTSRNLGGSP